MTYKYKVSWLFEIPGIDVYLDELQVRIGRGRCWSIGCSSGGDSQGADCVTRQEFVNYLETAEMRGLVTSEYRNQLIAKFDAYFAELVGRFAPSPQPSAHRPPIDEWFDLEVDNTIDPMHVAYSLNEFCFHRTKDDRYLGPVYGGKKIYRVKLIRLGYMRNPQAAREAAAQLGFRLLEGQGRDPLMKKFPNHNAHNIALGGSEWFVHCFRQIAYLSFRWIGGWEPGLRSYQDLGFEDDWLWAVVEKDN